MNSHLSYGLTNSSYMFYYWTLVLQVHPKEYIKGERLKAPKEEQESRQLKSIILHYL